MITQIEYERLWQEVDDLKRELVSCETLSIINAKIIRELHLERNELKQKLRDARAKERERCATICSHSTSMWECIEAIKALKDEE